MCKGKLERNENVNTELLKTSAQMLYVIIQQFSRPHKTSKHSPKSFMDEVLKKELLPLKH